MPYLILKEGNGYNIESSPSTSIANADMLEEKKKVSDDIGS